MQENNHLCMWSLTRNACICQTGKFRFCMTNWVLYLSIKQKREKKKHENIIATSVSIAVEMKQRVSPARLSNSNSSWISFDALECAVK